MNLISESTYKKSARAELLTVKWAKMHTKSVESWAQIGSYFSPCVSMRIRHLFLEKKRVTPKNIKTTQKIGSNIVCFEQIAAIVWAEMATTLRNPLSLPFVFCDSQAAWCMCLNNPNPFNTCSIWLSCVTLTVRRPARIHATHDKSQLHFHNSMWTSWMWFRFWMNF